MDLILSISTFALANVLLFVPFDSRIFWLLQILLVVLLAALLLVKFFQSRRPKATGEGREIPEPKPVQPAQAQAAVAPDALVEGGVVQFLARLQEKGRLVDFLVDDITPYSNEQVGVVARVVHQGCREVLRAAFDIEPVHPGKEREDLSLAGDFDSASYRLVGKVPDRPPYRGTVLHRGWKVSRISLPRLAEASSKAAAGKIIAPAEVEIG